MDVHVFLFTDLLLITKAKKGDKFKVIKPVSESYLDHYNDSDDVFKSRAWECRCDFSCGE